MRHRPRDRDPIAETGRDARRRVTSPQHRRACRRHGGIDPVCPTSSDLGYRTAGRGLDRAAIGQQPGRQTPVEPAPATRDR